MAGCSTYSFIPGFAGTKLQGYETSGFGSLLDKSCDVSSLVNLDSEWPRLRFFVLILSSPLLRLRYFYLPSSVLPIDLVGQERCIRDLVSQKLLSDLARFIRINSSAANKKKCKCY
jgi:hypothetical protein